MKKIIPIVLLVLVCIMTCACKSIYTEVKISTSTKYENGQYIKTATLKNITDRRLGIKVGIVKDYYQIRFIPPGTWVRAIYNTSNDYVDITLDPMKEASLDVVQEPNTEITFKIDYSRDIK